MQTIAHNDYVKYNCIFWIKTHVLIAKVQIFILHVFCVLCSVIVKIFAANPCRILRRKSFVEMTENCIETSSKCYVVSRQHIGRFQWLSVSCFQLAGGSERACVSAPRSVRLVTTATARMLEWQLTSHSNNLERLPSSWKFRKGQYEMKRKFTKFIPKLFFAVPSNIIRDSIGDFVDNEIFYRPARGC